MIARVTPVKTAARATMAMEVIRVLVPKGLQARTVKPIPMIAPATLV